VKIKNQFLCFQSLLIMLQRIQSIFLLIAGICGIIVAFADLAQFTSENTHYIFRAYSIKMENNGLLTEYQKTYPVAILANTSGVLAFIILFLFKNRKLQLKLGKLLLLTSVLLVASIFLYVDSMHKVLDPATQTNYLLGSFLPPVMIICAYLANKFIKKDEDLIKSVNRLR